MRGSAVMDGERRAHDRHGQSVGLDEPATLFDLDAAAQGVDWRLGSGAGRQGCNDEGRDDRKACGKNLHGCSLEAA